MMLIRGLNNLRPAQQGAIITIGTFDGLHLGHQALIGEVLSLAARLERPPLMLTFEPMPREAMNPGNPPPRLTSFRERWRELERCGLAALCVLRFTPALRALSGAQFVALLRDRLRVAAVVVGHDFRFARGGEASAELLQQAGAAGGFAVSVLAPVLVDGERVSSSAIRAALASGDLERAARLLGRPYSMRGRVVPGQKLGRELGYPTANLRLERRATPLAGIFAVRVRGIRQDGRGLAARDAVASLGTRPTVDGVGMLLEAHVFDFDGDLYGQELEVQFVQRLRDELRFDNLAALVLQMHRDAAAARAILAR